MSKELAGLAGLICARELFGTKEVATALDISVKTAETHRTNIMRKLKLHSVGELIRYAIRNNMIKP